MEPVVCRFRYGRIGSETLLVLVSCALLALSLVPRIPFPAGWPTDPMGWILATTCTSWVLLAWFRWRSHFRVDEWGIEYRRSNGRVVKRLDWGEIDEVFLLGWSEFEVRGAGKRIRLSGPYEHLRHARERSVPRLTAIRDHLRTRAFEQGKLEFRMPGGRWKAHLAYLAAVLVLTALTGFCLAPLIKGRFYGYPLLFIFFGGSWLWGLRKRASGLGTRVTLHREGIVVRRLDGKDRVAWAEFDHSEWNDRDGLDLVLKSRRVISLPRSLGNLAMLEEFLREGPPSVDSGSPGEAEGRTMMQSP